MAFNLKLPPHSNGGQDVISSGRQRIIVIGANGAGKTRFTERLIADCAGKAFRVSALNAIYNSTTSDSLVGSIDSLYKDAVNNSPFVRNDNRTQLERLTALMMNEEMIALLNHKLAVAESGNDSRELPISKFDIVARAWHEAFPNNRILRESGKLLFANHQQGESYSPVRLSDGEKAVLYYLGTVLYAPENGVIFVDSPDMFLHPSVTTAIWDRIEGMRPDCQWIYTTHNIEFLASKGVNSEVIWVRGFDAEAQTWDYVVMPDGDGLSDDIYLALIGARKPVLFIEGDGKNSIDAKLYPLIFTDYTVRSLGSCNRVIEATRTFNDLSAFHHLDSHGVVDRDRRDTSEVAYLRKRKIFVPDVAEIENVLMLEDVIRAVAQSHGRNADNVFNSVKRAIMGQFRHDLHKQALEHTRNRVKRLMEFRADGRFNDINSLENHVKNIVYEIQPRALYEKFCREFSGYLADGDYKSVLRVYNQKSMVPQSNVAQLCGLQGKDSYINDIIGILKRNSREAAMIRSAVAACFGLTKTGADIDI
ncbi:MAG: DUF4435 domain-containing protein [Muribaculum sp.]|nr:DUF4435 domain-containing protein [Muribaculaceae bacterium]MCM1081142.1 DUF4435 domain-containing protein [Muribaculum sp.]